jgi:crossover junction endodeoxyribonuclease RuvC
VTTRVLGIDPGTALTGYGVVEPADGQPGRLLECGVIRTDATGTTGSRLDTLFQGVGELIARHRPTAVAVETPFLGKNARAALALGQARAVVLLAAARFHVEVHEFTPATVKKCIVGKGGAAKAQVGYMVQQLLRLERPPKPPDAADGVAIALTWLLKRRLEGMTAARHHGSTA